MGRRGELSLGDMLTAFKRLNPIGKKSCALLLQMLDPQGVLASTDNERRLNWRPAPSASRPQPPPSLASNLAKAASEKGEARGKEVFAAGEAIPMVLQRTQRVAPAAASLAPYGEVLELPPTSPPTIHPPSPLFVPEWQAGILTAALAVPRPEGAIDVDKAVPLLARRMPVKAFPKRQIHSLSLGVRVLSDVSESMVPFARDREQILSRIRAVVGPDRTEVHRFEGVPSRGVRSQARAKLEPFEPPPNGTPLLILSDLGIGSSPLGLEQVETSEWLHFIELARRAGCRVVALVPYTQARWPRALRRRMVLVQWDRHTTARAVLQAFQR